MTQIHSSARNSLRVCCSFLCFWTLARASFAAPGTTMLYPSLYERLKTPVTVSQTASLGSLVQEIARGAGLEATVDPYYGDRQLSICAKEVPCWQTMNVVAENVGGAWEKSDNGWKLVPAWQKAIDALRAQLEEPSFRAFLSLGPTSQDRVLTALGNYTSLSGMQSSSAQEFLTPQAMDSFSPDTQRLVRLIAFLEWLRDLKQTLLSPTRPDYLTYALAPPIRVGRNQREGEGILWGFQYPSGHTIVLTIKPEEMTAVNHTMPEWRQLLLPLEKGLVRNVALTAGRRETELVMQELADQTGLPIVADPQVLKWPVDMTGAIAAGAAKVLPLLNRSSCVVFSFLTHGGISVEPGQLPLANGDLLKRMGTGRNRLQLEKVFELEPEAFPGAIKDLLNNLIKATTVSPNRIELTDLESSTHEAIPQPYRDFMDAPPKTRYPLASQVLCEVEANLAAETKGTLANRLYLGSAQVNPTQYAQLLPAIVTADLMFRGKQLSSVPLWWEQLRTAKLRFGKKDSAESEMRFWVIPNTTPLIAAYWLPVPVW